MASQTDSTVCEEGAVSNGWFQGESKKEEAPLAHKAPSDKITAIEGKQQPPSGPSGSIFWSRCVFILITEFCERLAYYGLVNPPPAPAHTSLSLSQIGSLSIFLTRELGLTSLMASEL